MPPRSKQPPANQLSFTCLADMMPRGDGSFILRPRPVDGDLDSWVSVREAGKLMCGTRPLSRQTVKSLIDLGHLVARRPSPHKTQVSLKSIQAHLAQSKDPEFWDPKPPVISTGSAP